MSSINTASTTTVMLMTPQYIYNVKTAVEEAITRSEDCITDVSNWMNRSALKINEDKTEFKIFSANHYTYDQMSIKIGTNTIQHNNTVKILGVTLDTHMTLEKQISNTCRTSYMQIRRISSIGRYLTVDAVNTGTGHSNSGVRLL